VSKATVTRLFIGSAIAAIAGAILAIAAVWIAIANDVFVMNGQDIVGVQGGTLAWRLLGLGVIGGLAFTGAMIGGLVSWIGALLNTSQLESKGWFLLLLLLGIFSFGLIGMIAYLIAGPDGTRETARRTTPIPA
jgi:MFS family permease